MLRCLDFISQAVESMEWLSVAEWHDLMYSSTERMGGAEKGRLITCSKGAMLKCGPELMVA